MIDLRVAVFAHSHPALTKGGGEIIAHRSFLHLREVCAHARLFTAAPAVMSASSIFARDEHIVEYDSDEFLLNAQHYDHFLGSTSDWQLLGEIAAACEAQNINVFHFHHFFRLGVNAATYLQTRFPDAIFILTLHEYLSICYQHGQMVKRNTRLLCDRSSPIDCHMCFPGHSKEEFHLRRSFFLQTLKSFHAVTAPSRFLADRIEAAGLVERVQLVPNGTSGLGPLSVSRKPEPDLHSKFGFFGQNTPFKGLDVYLKAAVMTLEKLGPSATFSVFGCDAQAACQMPECQDLAQAFGKWSGYIQFRGIYDPRAVIDHMQSFGWIVVPSIWWENSPIVIQEAFLAGRPVICSDIGGMKEGVTHEQNGLHFRASDSADLAGTFERCLSDREIWSRLSAQIQPPQTVEQMNSRFMEIYREGLKQQKL